MEHYRFKLPLRNMKEIELDLVIDNGLSFKFTFNDYEIDSCACLFSEDFFKIDELIKQKDLDDFTYPESAALVIGFSFFKVYSGSLDNIQLAIESYISGYLEAFFLPKKYELEIYSEGFETFALKFRERNHKITSRILCDILDFNEKTREVIFKNKVINFGRGGLAFLRVRALCLELMARQNDPSNKEPIQIHGKSADTYLEKHGLAPSGDYNLKHIFKGGVDKVQEFANIDDNYFSIK